MQEMQEMRVQYLDWEDPLGEGKRTHSSILAWEVLWTQEPGGLQSVESQRIRQQLKGLSMHTHEEEDNAR